MYQLTKKKAPLWSKVVVFLVLCALASELLKVIFGGPTLDEALMQTSGEINKHCPIIIDSTTRLDNTGVLAGKYLAYNYTLLQYADEVRSDTAYYKKAMSENMLNMVKTNPRLAAAKKEGIGFAATWYDSSGSYICSLVIQPEDYK
jgi:hypothetical protein